MIHQITGIIQYPHRCLFYHCFVILHKPEDISGLIMNAMMAFFQRFTLCSTEFKFVEIL